MPEKEIIIEIALERLRAFTGSPFSVAMDEPMEDLIESIRIYGMRWSQDTAGCMPRSCSDWNGFRQSSGR